MKRRTFISLMSVMAAAGVLTLSGCSNSSGSTAASGTAVSVAPAAGDQLSNICIIVLREIRKLINLSDIMTDCCCNK